MSYVYFIVINNVLCYHLSAIATGSDISSIAYRIQSLWFRKFPKHCEHRPFRILWNESRKQSDAKKENAGSCVRASDWKRHAVCESVCVGMRGCEECLQCVTSVHMKSENVECRNGRAHWPHKRRKTLRAMEPPPSFLEYYHDRLCVWVWAVVCVPVCIVFV